jgi:hypothetical protein
MALPKAQAMEIRKYFMGPSFEGELESTVCTPHRIEKLVGRTASRNN